MSITGLLDWGSNAEPAAINRLKGVVDEVVVQTYQGRHSIPNHAAYLPRVSRLQLPYRIGLVQGGDWQAPRLPGKEPLVQGLRGVPAQPSVSAAASALAGTPAAAFGLRLAGILAGLEIAHQ